jgi:hypothetical protein
LFSFSLIKRVTILARVFYLRGFMRFFIPSTDDTRQAEEVYRKIREELAASVGSITEKRIYRLKLGSERGAQNVIVGSDKHEFGSGPVLAIFEGTDGVHYICTQKRSVSEAEPHPVPTTAIIDREDFSALA